MKTAISLDRVSIAVICGSLPLLLLPELPAGWIYPVLLATVLLLLLLQRQVYWLFAMLILSFLWSTYVASFEVEKINRYANKTMTLSGQVMSINLLADDPQRVLFRVDSVNGKPLSFGQGFNLLLNWPLEQQRIAAGQYWQLDVNTRPAHSRLNQGGFDQQRWAIANGQGIRGVVKGAKPLLLDEGIRQKIIDSVWNKVLHLPTVDILIALAFGERGLMQSERKALLLQTGTAHLMAISGLHISLAALLGWCLSRSLQWFLPTDGIGPYWPRLMSWLAALVYVWLSGANLPALRALLALTFWLCLGWRGYLLSSWQVWLRIVALLLLYDPLTILSESAWLSCSAVACLIFWFQYAPLPARFFSWHWAIVRWGHLQLAMMLLLLPLQVVIFKGISWTSLPANLIAVPAVSFITVPCILFAVLLDGLPVLSLACWQLADLSLQAVLWAMAKLQVGWLVITKQLSVMSLMGWLMLIVWRLSLWRSSPVLLAALVALALYPDWYKPAYLWRVDMLDVGHGLAVVIHNGHQAVIYDTGSRWPGGSMAEREILPFLRWHGLKLEGIIISHQDLDHIGGLDVLQQAYPDSWLLSTSNQVEHFACLQGGRLEWRGLQFNMLWPLARKERAYNADSCVIKVTDGKHSILLTGDLETAQELALVRTLASELKSDILQTPHHGSNTSSSGPFLRAVKPELALTSVARFSPWRLPAEKVRRRYDNMQIRNYSTAMQGQLSILFYQQKFQVLSYRRKIMPRWYHQLFGSDKDNE